MPELTDKSCGAGRPDGLCEPYRLSAIPHSEKRHDTQQEIAVAVGQTLQDTSGDLTAVNRKYDGLLENGAVTLQQLQQSPERVAVLLIAEIAVLEANCEHFAAFEVLRVDAVRLIDSGVF